MKKMNIENNPDTTNDTKSTESGTPMDTENSDKSDNSGKPDDKSDSTMEPKPVAPEASKEENEPCEEKYVYNDLIQFYNIVST